MSGTNWDLIDGWHQLESGLLAFPKLLVANCNELAVLLRSFGAPLVRPVSFKFVKNYEAGNKNTGRKFVARVRGLRYRKGIKT